MASPHPSRADPELPDIDQRLVAPDTRYEILDGELVYVSPADPPHGTRHAQIAALVEAHVGLDFEVACELLTRTSETSDIAPDVSVYPQAPNPETGGRQIEQLAFEVVSTQSISHAGRKAAKLAARGVRRVFAIDVERSRALEWSVARDTWDVLDPDGFLEDPVLDAALPIAALIHGASTDDAVARALLIKHNPVLEAARARDHEEGKASGITDGKAIGLEEGEAAGFEKGKAVGLARGRAEALLSLLTVRGLPVREHERSQILAERSTDQLDRWLRQALTCASVAEMLAER